MFDSANICSFARAVKDFIQQEKSAFEYEGFHFLNSKSKQITYSFSSSHSLYFSNYFRYLNSVCV